MGTQQNEQPKDRFYDPLNPFLDADRHTESLSAALAWGDDPYDRPYHPETRCAGHACPFHSPSDHPLNQAKRNIRFDRYGLVERLCTHGVGHPDPDSVAFNSEKFPESEFSVHGCDGCCSPQK